MKKAIKIILIILLCIVIALALVIAGVLIKQHVSISNMEKNCTMENSPTADYTDLIPEQEETYQTVKDLVAMGPRKPGTKAGKAAQDYVKEQYEKIGLEDVQILPSKSTLWKADDWGLTVDGQEIPTYCMTHTMTDNTPGSFSTPEGGLDTEIVYVGAGEEEDFDAVDVKGKIVLADVEFTEIPMIYLKAMGFMYYDPEGTMPFTGSGLNPYSDNTYPWNYYEAMERGAAGYIGYLEDCYIDTNVYENEDYSYLGGPMEMPGLWVSQKDGKALIETIEAAGGSAKANMHMSGSLKEVDAGAVIGYLPGKSDDVIMVHSHHDSSTPGAVEDASGTAAVLSIAKFYAQIPQEKREKTLMFVSMDTHFADYETHDAFIEKYLKDEDHSGILADICIEHVANQVDENGELTGLCEPRICFTSEVGGFKKITNEEFVRHHLDRIANIPSDLFGDEPPTDADMFYQEGVPIISYISGPIYLYADVDTSDKVSPDQLQKVTEAFIDITWRVSEMPAEDFAE